MWQGWISGIIGVWLFITPFFGAYQPFYTWSNFISGIIIGILGITMIGIKNWQGWVSFFLGIWLIISAFIPGLHYGAGAYINDIICGVIAMIAGFSATQLRQRRAMAGGYGRTAPNI